MALTNKYLVFSEIPSKNFNKPLKYQLESIPFINLNWARASRNTIEFAYKKEGKTREVIVVQVLNNT